MSALFLQVLSDLVHFHFFGIIASAAFFFNRQVASLPARSRVVEVKKIVRDRLDASAGVALLLAIAAGKN